MIRLAKKADATAIVNLMNVVFHDMELDIFKKMNEEDFLQAIIDSFENPNYRANLDNILVYENENGEVVGVAVGYPERLEDNGDEPLKKELVKYGISEDYDVFPDKEAKPGEWYLDTLVVHNKARGQGIGSDLLNALPSFAKDKGESLLSLNVDFDNDRAKKLYKKSGFEEDGTVQIGSHMYTHMVKKI